MRKKIIGIIMCAFFSIGLIETSFASNMLNSSDLPSVEMDENQKISFAEAMDKKYQQLLHNQESKLGSRSQLDMLMEQATFARGSEKENLKRELSKYGVYMYDGADEIETRSGSGDVALTAPTIFYEAWEKTWTVTCGGNWKNENWVEQILIGNTGGEDAFGVGYTNTSNSYKSSVVRTSAYITDEYGDKMVSTSNRSDGDGSKGFGFRLQDYMYNKNTDSRYVGYKWYGSCTYDSNFGTYSGVATAYYIHTYDKANISSISFGLNGKTGGLGIEISSNENSFTAFSADKTFGTY